MYQAYKKSKQMLTEEERKEIFALAAKQQELSNALEEIPFPGTFPLKSIKLEGAAAPTRRIGKGRTPRRGQGKNARA